MINLTNFRSCASYQLLVWLKPPQISPMRYKNTKTRSVNPKKMRMRKDGEDRQIICKISFSVKKTTKYEFGRTGKKQYRRAFAKSERVLFRMEKI